MTENNEEGVRTVDALSEEEFLKLVLNTLNSTDELKSLGKGMMELAEGVATAIVRLAYDRKVVIVRKENE
jgi:hypothetical protein